MESQTRRGRQGESATERQTWRGRRGGADTKYSTFERWIISLLPLSPWIKLKYKPVLVFQCCWWYGRQLGRSVALGFCAAQKHQNYYRWYLIANIIFGRKTSASLLFSSPPLTCTSLLLGSHQILFGDAACTNKTTLRGEKYKTLCHN